MKNSIKKIHYIFIRFGINLHSFLSSIRGMPAYIKDYIYFRSMYEGVIKIDPCLTDRYAACGSYFNEYFWQDLLVARLIHKINPKRHVDVGSRIDGFIGQLASFREVEVIDVRKPSIEIDGIKFHVADMSLPENTSLLRDAVGSSDSVSCLHALEHFGLGRYGDRVVANGFQEGIKNLISLLSSSGYLYLSVPIGSERVQFNANYVFNPSKLNQLVLGYGMVLDSFYAYSPEIGPIEIDSENLDSEFIKLEDSPYALGIFVYKKC